MSNNEVKDLSEFTKLVSKYKSFAMTWIELCILEGRILNLGRPILGPGLNIHTKADFFFIRYVTYFLQL